MKTTLNSRFLFPVFIFFLLINLVSWGQTNPGVVYDLASGSWTLAGWSSTVGPGLYPTNGATGLNATTGVSSSATTSNLRFWKHGNNDPALTTTESGDLNTTINYSAANGKIVGNGANGFYFDNTGGAGVGSAILSVNTTNRNNIQVTWTGRTIAVGARTYQIRLMYRIGSSGTWLDANSTQSNILYSAGTAGSNTVMPTITLPSAVDNQSVVQIMWRYYYSGTTTGTRPSLGVDDISVTSSALPACISPTSLAATASSSAQTTTTISGSFTAAASAPSGYLVVRTTTNSQPTPTTGTTYTVGSNAIGYIEYVGASAGSWSSTILTAGTTYYYWVFSYNNTNCTGGPAYSSTTTTFSQATTNCTGANLANLSYTNVTPTYCSGVAITTNAATLGTTFGTVSYSVSPSLPTGLSLSSSTGNITGTPSSTSASTSYTVTADNGCFTTTTTITIQVVTPLSGLDYTTSTATYCVGTQITSNLVTAITGGGTISYSSTSLPTGMSLNSSTGEISGTPASSSASSTYTITATNGGCSATKSLTIAVNNTLSNSVLSYSVSNPTYCASTAITTNSAALSTSTNNGTVAYSISPSLPTGLVLNTSSGSITGTPTVSQNSTSYTITVANSCASTTANIAITINALPAVSISSSTNTYCGTAITLNASGASSYIWSPSTGLTGTTGNSVDASPSSTTTYTVTGTDANGCVASANKVITKGNPLTMGSVTASAPSACSGGTVQLNGSASLSSSGIQNYSFSAANSTYSSITGTDLTGASNIGDDLGSGNLPIGFNFPYNGTSHSVFAMSSNGLIILGNSTASIIGYSSNALASNANIIALLWDDNNTTGGSMTYLTTGSAPNRVLTVQWTNMHVAGTGSSTNPTISGHIKLYESGIIELIYGSTSAALSSPTATIGISGGSGQYLSVSPASQIGASSISTSSENSSVNTTYLTSGTKFTFTPPTISYAWTFTDNTNSLSSTTITNPVATVNATDTYTLTATGTDGCTASGSVAIALGGGSPSVTASTTASTVCSGTSITLSSTLSGGCSPFTYSWSDGTTIVSTASSFSISPTSTKTYTLTLTDNNSASSTSSVTVNVNSLPSLSVNSGTYCSGGSALALSVSGASTYTWTPSTGLSSSTGSSVTASPSATTTYTVTGTDPNGCIASAQALVTFGNSPTLLTLSASSANICNGSNINLFANSSSNSSTNITLASENFDSGLPSGWVIVQSGTGNLWGQTTSTTYGTPYAGSGMLQYVYNANNAANTYAISSGYSLEAGVTYTISFYELTSSLDEKLKLTVGTAQTAAAQSTIIYDYGAHQVTSWTLRTNTFTPSATGTYYFGLHAYSAKNKWYIDVDNFTVTYPTPSTYSWTSNPSGFTSSTQNPTSVAPTQTTTYSVTATNSFGCTSSANVTVTVNQPTITWTGATSTDPTVASNWNPSGVPCTVSDVTIPSGLTNYPTYTSLTISSGGSYTLQSGAQLTVTGALTNNGTMTIESGATFKQGTSLTSVTGSGTYNVKQTIDNGAGSGTTLTGRFWYLGSPLACTRSSSFGTSGSLNKVWEFTNGAYANVGDATSLDPTKGYVHRRSDASTTLTFSGQNLYAQDATLSLSNNAGTYGGWHLISNPYTAYLDWNQIVSNSTGMSNTYYIRSYNSNNQDVDALISYNAANGLESNTSSFALGNTGSTTAQYIAPLQAFWVKVPPTSTLSSSAGQLNLQRAFTSHQTGNVGLKNTGVYPVLAKVNLYNGAKYDQALVYMNEFMTNAFDQNDSEKMFVSGVASVYTMASGKKLVMNGIKNNKKKISVPLYLELPTSKVYQLQLSDYIMEDGLILLEDKQEGTIQDFTIHDTYSFYANSGMLSNRFVLHFFMPDAGVSAQGPSNNWVEEEESVINEGGSILVSSNGRGKVTITQDIDASAAEKGSVVVRDAAGREIYNGQLTGSATHLELDAPSGIYFVSVELNGQVEVKKIFVQQ